MRVTRQLRRLLLGGGALLAMAGAATADELSALKERLEALQMRMETGDTDLSAPLDLFVAPRAREGSVQFDLPGGHQVHLGSSLEPANGGVANASGGEPNAGWSMQAGADLNLDEAVTLSLGATYGGTGSASGNPAAALRGSGFSAGAAPGASVFAGLTFDMSETTSINVGWGYAEGADLHTVHGNILWKPSEQLQMGWELIWADGETLGFGAGAPTGGEADSLKVQWGAWFFF